jgi:DNA-directed RNA polymerase subunit E'/Rpb7
MLTLLQTKFADLVQISPDDFRKQSHVAIEDNINAKYANKVGTTSPPTAGHSSRH